MAEFEKLMGYFSLTKCISFWCFIWIYSLPTIYIYIANTFRFGSQWLCLLFSFHSVHLVQLSISMEGRLFSESWLDQGLKIQHIKMVVFIENLLYIRHCLIISPFHRWGEATQKCQMTCWKLSGVQQELKNLSQNPYCSNISEVLKLEPASESTRRTYWNMKLLGPPTEFPI